MPDNLTEKTLSSEAKKTHKHNKDNHLGVSPHMLKCTEYQGRRVQMGMCRLLLWQQKPDFPPIPILCGVEAFWEGLQT